MASSLAVLCGQLVVVGIAGTALSATEERKLASGERGGVVLFKRNLVHTADGPRALVELTGAIARTAPSELPPLVAIDQEGGRVVRIGPPALALPPMRRIGDLGDVAFATQLAAAQGRELAALGITMSFAPVADIHTRAENPIIGDRAFAETPEGVIRFAEAWARGLTQGGVLSCSKHYPGHGDTTVDSHLALPRVERPLEELERIELAPFRALAQLRAVDAIMTAHVVFPALADGPATLSRHVCTEILRERYGFEGVLFSDDLEMKAIELPVGDAATQAVAAGCDIVLVCSREDLAEETHAALVLEAERSPAFRARCEEAAGRALSMRRRVPPRPLAAGELAAVFAASRTVADELTRRLEQPS